MTLVPGNGSGVPAPLGLGEPTLGIALASLRMPTLDERLDWAAAQGFAGVELLATGEPWGVHTPSVSKEERLYLREKLAPFSHIAVQAPHQATFDVTLVSPSAAIRRASVSEIWSVFRFVEAVGGGVVLVRTGTPPTGVSEDRVATYLAECLTTLDRMAGDHNARIGLLNADVVTRLPLLESLNASGSLRHTGMALDIAAARAAGQSPATVTALLDGPSAGRVLHVRVPGFDLPSRLNGGSGGMLCLTFDTPPGVSAPAALPEEIARRKADWERHLRA